MDFMRYNTFFVVACAAAAKRCFSTAVHRHVPRRAERGCGGVCSLAFMENVKWKSLGSTGRRDRTSTAPELRVQRSLLFVDEGLGTSPGSSSCECARTEDPRVDEPHQNPHPYSGNGASFQTISPHSLSVLRTT